VKAIDFIKPLSEAAKCWFNGAALAVLSRAIQVLSGVICKISNTKGIRQGGKSPQITSSILLLPADGSLNERTKFSLHRSTPIDKDGENRL